MRHLSRVLVTLAIFGLGGHARAQIACPVGTLPAYAHNDYENARPLTDALRLGFRGVEADVYLIGAALRLGHSARAAAVGPTLEATYLRPLRDIAVRCGGRIVVDDKPFLLTIELKASLLPAFDSLAALLARYPDLLAPIMAAGDGARKAPIEVVLVGWHPPVAVLQGHSTLPRSIGIQLALEPRAAASTVGDTTRVRLLSINYGKAIARRWRRDPAPAEWLPALIPLRRAYRSARVRVFNAPVDRSLYRQLLAGGVDLIGSENPAATAHALSAVAGATEAARAGTSRGAAP